MSRSLQLDHHAGDERFDVRGAVDVDGYPGAAVLVQHQDSCRLEVRREAISGWGGRGLLFDLERRFKLVHAS